MRLLVDQGLTTPGGDVGGKLLAIRRHFGLLFAVAVALGIFTAARFFMVSWLGDRVTTDLRQAVYAHVLQQSPQFFETLKTGEVLSRLTTDTTVIQNAVGSSISMGLRNAVLFTGGIAMLVATSPRLMLTVVGVIALVVVPAMLIGRRVRRLSRASQDRIADSSAIAGEVLNAVQVVQSYTQEGNEARRFHEANERSFDTAVRRTGTRATLTAFVIIGVFGALLYGLYGGVQAVMAGRITAGELSQTALYITVVAGAAAVLGEVWGDLLRASGATERLMELLNTESPIAPPHSPVPLPAAPRGARVEFDRVVFTYPSRPQHRVLDDLSLSIEPGQTVALVGPSGAGKSTVFQLLQRFYDTRDGAVRVDGVDVRRRGVRSPAAPDRGGAAGSRHLLRLGARQHPVWPPRRHRRRSARAAARAAHVEEFVMRLPDGYATEVGERGLRLSGGQRQRLAIARAILKNAPLLLLDEATSALDAESERAVQSALETAMRGRTTDRHRASPRHGAAGRLHLRTRARPCRRGRTARPTRRARRPVRASCGNAVRGLNRRNHEMHRWAKAAHQNASTGE